MTPTLAMARAAYDQGKAPTILIYTCPEAPEQARCIARFMLDGDYHPVIISAADPIDAETRARAWWASEAEKTRRRHGLTEARVAAMKVARAKAKAKAALQPQDPTHAE